MNTHQALFASAAPQSSNNSLLIALCVAAIIHVAIGWGVNFTSPEPEQVSRAVDITLVNTPIPQAPAKTQALAQENQQGAGEQSTMEEIPKQQQLPKQISELKRPSKKSSPISNESKAQKYAITQKKAEKKVIIASKPKSPVQTEKHQHLSADMLQQQITQLGTEIRLSQQSEQSKIKFIDSVSAHKYVAAQYMKDWDDKVERTGNLNYPEVAAKKNFSGTLTMDVGIKADGSIYSIRINQSSGNPALDEAAKRIVRMSAPFAPLPLDLLKELDVLVITRVWKFSDESGMTTR